MKIALQLGLLPGESVADKISWAADHGVEGIEISAWNYGVDQIPQALKDFENSKVPVVSICGNPSFDFLDPDPKKRRVSIDQSKKYLELAGKFRAVGQIVPPIFGPPRINDLSPLKDAVRLEKDLLVEICKELGDYARKQRTLFLLEPLNRYEQHLLRKQSDGVEIIKRAKSPNVALISDFFHMHIEETNTPNALKSAGKYVKHVHLADNTRLEPGTGDINFVAGFKALHSIGFKGYMAYECGISGQDKAKSLIKSLEFTRRCIAEAKAK
ncbi:MAG TPA: sugar phosphate isomerase/epimerase family protein [Planctomycetota bacterium]|nr:sugar phosphate isomerase/epimerase family protein [Planctomycetota bacterium]